MLVHMVPKMEFITYVALALSSCDVDLTALAPCQNVPAMLLCELLFTTLLRLVLQASPTPAVPVAKAPKASKAKSTKPELDDTAKKAVRLSEEAAAALPELDAAQLSFMADTGGWGGGNEGQDPPNAGSKVINHLGGWWGFSSSCIDSCWHGCR